jgi:cytoskeletal protein RodZ
MGKWGWFLRKGKEGASQQKDETQQHQALQKAHLGSALGELGQMLRQTREGKSITLEQVEEHTRIRLKYLLALEEARYDDLPTLVHVHGFLTNYARFLGLDMDEVEALFAKDRAAHRRFEPGIFHPKNIELIPRKPLVRANLVLSIVIVILLAAVGWVFWQYGWPLVQSVVGMAATPTATPTATLEAVSVKPSETSTRKAVVPSATTTPAPATATSVAGSTATETPVPIPTATATLDAPLTIATPTPDPTATAMVTSTRTEGVVLSLKFTDRVWLQVTVDGQESPGEMFEVDEEKTWEGQFTIYLICGNAGGVEATVNGVELGILGERAEVVEKTWGPQGEVTPTPEPEGTPSATPTEAP